MAVNEDTSPPKSKKKLFSRWRRKGADAEQEKSSSEAEAGAEQQSEAGSEILEPEGARPIENAVVPEDLASQDNTPVTNELIPESTDEVSFRSSEADASSGDSSHAEEASTAPIEPVQPTQRQAENDLADRPESKFFSRWRRKGLDVDQEKSPTEADSEVLESEGTRPIENAALSEDLASTNDAPAISELMPEEVTDEALFRPGESDASRSDSDDQVGGTSTEIPVETVQPPRSSVEAGAGVSKFEQVGVELAEPLRELSSATVVSEPDEASAEALIATPVAEPVVALVDKSKRPNVFRRAMSKTGRGLETFFLGRRQIDEEMLEDLETQLLMADVGIEVCTDIIDKLTDRVKRKELSDSDALRGALHQIMVEILQPCEQALDVSCGQPCVILVVGINGVGKTTTIGKLAHNYQNQGLSVMLAAGDTFRAAAVEQLQAWGDKNEVQVIAQHTGADSASVIYDAIESATARNTDVLIADTAGRLHTKSNLMEELAKVKRVMAKLNEDAPHEVLLVLDAGTGQNALRQVQEFNETVAVTGLAITKLDGTAKGGVVLALCRQYGIPVRYIGVGEGLDDLQDFRADDYVQALLSEATA